MAATSGASEEGEAARTLAGVASVLLQLRPGVQARLTYESPGPGWGLALGGHSASISDGNVTFTRILPWQMPSMTLAPGVTYSIGLSGGLLKVEAVV